MTSRPTDSSAASRDDRQAREMRRADIANGEGPDDPDDAPSASDSAPHRTGPEQAERNRENDPPA